MASSITKPDSPCTKPNHHLLHKFTTKSESPYQRRCCKKIKRKKRSTATIPCPLQFCHQIMPCSPLLADADESTAQPRTPPQSSLPAPSLRNPSCLLVLAATTSLPPPWHQAQLSSKPQKRRKEKKKKREIKKSSEKKKNCLRREEKKTEEHGQREVQPKKREEK